MHTMSDGLRKLTKRVSGIAHRPKFKPPAPAIMADQEEDFSSLPLPDRFQHKVSEFGGVYAYMGEDSDVGRYGKFAKPHTKMLRSSSR